MIETEPRGDDLRSDEPLPPSLTYLLRVLFEDAQTLLEAELGYWRTATGFAVRQTKTIAILVVGALFLAFFTLMAVVVGLLLALAPLIGAWGAMGAVSLGLLLACVVCVRLAMGRAKRMVRLLLPVPPKDAP